MTLPRPEYPRPQFVRSDWLCLNGEWEFEIDAGDSGLDRGLLHRPLTGRITVPFCPESELSGVHHTDFMAAVWYRRIVDIPQNWSGRQILLHFGAVDYDATVWVNGVEAGRHRGGFSPFTCYLKDVSGGKTIEIVVRARDPHQPGAPLGKQSTRYAPYACFYTRTTGIWQTVWMEPVGEISLKRPRITPDAANGLFRLEQQITGSKRGIRLFARLTDFGGTITESECSAELDLTPRLDLAIPADRRRLWSPADPFLYGIEIEIRDAEGKVLDAASSYAGLRSISISGHRILLNGEVLFQRLVLDQGYYPDGVMTAPTDEALRHDIELSMSAGFNGARLHQKVFEERFLFHADRLGYMVWGEFADWGCSGRGPLHDHQQPGITYAAQWLEVLDRDYSHPCIIGWCPLNETAQTLHDRIAQLDDATRALFLAAKAMDTSRPVLDTSGYSHRVPEADVYDSHDYIMDKDFATGLAKFRARHAGAPEGKPFTNGSDTESSGRSQVWSIPYGGQPYFVSEFGGYKWNPSLHAKSAAENSRERSTSWGYGSDPVSLEEFYTRFDASCSVLLENPLFFGYCYTQLTDVYPEENGIFTFTRGEKFDIARIRAAQLKKAAIELEADGEDRSTTG